MPIAALCASHTPLKDYRSPGAEIEREVTACYSKIDTWIGNFAPELVVVLGPDHFNGFFYQLPCFQNVASSQNVIGVPPVTTVSSKLTIFLRLEVARYYFCR